MQKQPIAPRLLLSLGNGFRNRDDPQSKLEARKVYRLIIQKYPYTAHGEDAYYQLAMSLDYDEDVPRREEALSCLKKLVERYPNGRNGTIAYDCIEEWEDDSQKEKKEEQQEEE